MSEKLAARVRWAARELGEGGKTFGVNDLGDRIGIQSYADKKKIWQAIRDMVRYGEWERIDRGLYRLAEERDRNKPPQKRVVMNRILSMRGTVTIEDLQEMAGVKESYAREWIRPLIRLGVVKDHKNGRYQLIKDLASTPADTKKAERLRRLREKRKAELSGMILKVRGVLDAAEKIIAQLDGETVDEGAASEVGHES